MKDNEIYELMGKVVAVSKVLKRESSPEGPGGIRFRWEARPIKKRQGWVTGLRWLQVGIRVPESHRGWCEEEGYEPPSFKQTQKPIKCLIVAFWPTEKPVFVPMDGYTMLPENEVDRMFLSLSLAVPHRTTWRDKITDPDRIAAREKSEERVREFMRKESKDFPRDKKGRWTTNTYSLRNEVCDEVQ